MKYSELSLDAQLQKGLDSAGYITCLPVQELVLKNGLDGSDLYVQSQTGTGKTASYLTTVFQRILADKTLGSKKALILTPTRELAIQVEEEAVKLAQFTDIKAASFYGGVGYEKQLKAIKQNTEIIIGTPGRIIDLSESKKLMFGDIAFLIIDEADKMFDMGFYPDLRKILKMLPPPEKRQTMLFSATLNTWVKNLAWEYTSEAKEIVLESTNITAEKIIQKLFHVESSKKIELVLGIIQNEKPDNVLIFCNTKRQTEKLTQRLKANRIDAEYLSGDIPQKRRLEIINKFKNKKLLCLIATDVAARGIDIDNLEMVINFDLPEEPASYVHRIGRTARAGKTGAAYTFCSEQDVYNLPEIEKYIEETIPSHIPPEEYFVKDTGVLKTFKSGKQINKKREPDKTRKFENSKPKQNTVRKQKPEIELNTLCFEERMKYYKEKYNTIAERKKSKKKPVKRSGKASKQQNFNGNKNAHKKIVPVTETSLNLKKEKGIFAFIKKLFKTS